MRLGAALAALALLGAPDGGVEQGSICVPVPQVCAFKGAMTAEQAEAYERATRPDAGPREPGPALAIQIDNREPVPIGSKPVLLEGIPLGERHWFKLKVGQRTAESFRFRFEDYASPRLWFRNQCFYGTWYLQARQRADCPGS